MSQFGDSIRLAVPVVQENSQKLLANVASAVLTSIQSGSEVTGSPGQPVDTGALKASWQLDFASPTEATVSTNIVYAPNIEDGIGKYGPLTLRSQVGGFHSVALTVAGFSALVNAEKANL